MLYFLLALVIVSGAFLILAYPMVIVGAPDDADIKVPRHATMDNVKDSLEKYLGPKYASSVMRTLRLGGFRPEERYGMYHIAEGSNALSVARRLTSGAQTPVILTINGFRSFPRLIERISARLDFPADSLRKVLADPAVLAPYGLNPDNAMALFLNDSYELYWTASPMDVVKKFGANYNRVWNPDFRRAAALLGLTPAQITIISSIVDEETNDEREKGTVGRLYINRLKKGMKLQADPTVRFAVGDFDLRRIRANHLTVESPYNTYKYAGLPPGPIRTPSAATIEEVIESKPHDYLYMCAREDFSGSHRFAKTFAEHKENALRYRKALDERGIQ